MTEEIFKQDAKVIVDVLFESKSFKDHITRDNMSELQNIIEYMLSSKFKSYLKMKDLQNRINHIKQDKLPERLDYTSVSC